MPGDATIARVNLRQFTSSSVSYLTVPGVRNGFSGAFAYGDSVFFVPYGDLANGPGQPFTIHGNVLRVHMSLSSYSWLNVSDVHTELRGFMGGFRVDNYLYLVPHNNLVDKDGYVGRVDLDQFNVTGVSMLNLEAVNPAYAGFHGGFSDAQGEYGYLVPWGNSIENHGFFVKLRLSNFTFVSVTELPVRLHSRFGGFSSYCRAFLTPYGGCAPCILAVMDICGAHPVILQELVLPQPQNTGVSVGYANGFTTGDGMYAFFPPTEHNQLVRVKLF